MRSPLTVRVADGVRDQQVTRYVKGLRFTKTAPGGFHSASISVDAPEGLMPDLGAADRVFVYDGRTARTMWDGYVENPGRVTVSGGDSYSISAMGGQVLASDNAKAVVFRYRDMAGGEWQKHPGSLESASTGLETAVIPGVSAIKAMFQPGSPVTTGHVAAWGTSALKATGQRLHSATVTVRGGKNDANYWAGLAATENDDFFAAIFQQINLSTADTQVTIIPGGLYDPGILFVALQRNGGGATNIADNTTWAAFYDLFIAPLLVDAKGVGATPVNAATVLASEVVAHVLGDMMPQIDGATAAIAATTFPIDNLAYPDGVKPRQILDDLTLYEPDCLWEILESGSNGKHRFAYRPWPTEPRYEISGRDFTETGGETDLCNRIAVSWTDATGAKQVTTRTTTVEALGTRVKDADPITLPDGQGSQANAERVGDETLAALNTPARAGTAVVRQPILDRLTGLMVMPWEIEPGYPVRVRDLGVDLRLTEMTYEDTNCASTLTLGTPVLTQAQRIARLSR